MADALGVVAQELESQVVDVLSQPASIDHSMPWLETGALRDSIGHNIDGTMAIVGSTSDVAVDQELGTRTDPPRPFFSATAAAAANHLVQSIAASLARHIEDH